MTKSRWKTVGILSAVAIMLVDLGVIGLSAVGVTAGVALLVVIAIVPAIFWSLGLAETGQPMDLPDGEGRSVNARASRMTVATWLSGLFQAPRATGSGKQQGLAAADFERILIDVAGR
jgi:hypothetical protein